MIWILLKNKPYLNAQTPACDRTPTSIQKHVIASKKQAPTRNAIRLTKCFLGKQRSPLGR